MQPQKVGLITRTKINVNLVFLTFLFLHNPKQLFSISQITFFYAANNCYNIYKYSWQLWGYKNILDSSPRLFVIHINILDTSDGTRIFLIAFHFFSCMEECGVTVLIVALLITVFFFSKYINLQPVDHTMSMTWNFKNWNLPIPYTRQINKHTRRQVESHYKWIVKICLISLFK